MAFERFKKIRFTDRTASIGTTFKEPYRKIPAVLRLGKKAKKNGGFFDYDKLLEKIDPSIGGDPKKIHVEQDDTTKEIGLYVSDDIVNDDVMGGVSKSNVYINDDSHCVFTGFISTANNGGFCSLRYNFEKSSKSSKDFLTFSKLILCLHFITVISN